MVKHLGRIRFLIDWNDPFWIGLAIYRTETSLEVAFGLGWLILGVDYRGGVCR